jgi:hypothetical protein
MVDVLPTFNEPLQTGGGDGEADGNVDGDGEQVAGGGGPAGTGSEGMGGSTPGTRADGGMEGVEGGLGTMTTAEQVAILDRQLETSTGDFDALILEEQAKQRARDRERAESAQESTTAAGAGGIPSRNPYEGTGPVSGGGGGSTGGGMGGIARGGGGAPENPAIYAPPEDIPTGNDDDVVARQLREAAMREADPEVRERLWNEYRRYKGIKVPQEDG